MACFGYVLVPRPAQPPLQTDLPHSSSGICKDHRDRFSSELLTLSFCPIGLALARLYETAWVSFAVRCLIANVARALLDSWTLWLSRMGKR